MNRDLDKSLDEILAERPQGGRGSRSNRGNNRGQRRERQDQYPRDGVRKLTSSRSFSTGQSFRDDAPRNLDSEWVHDRYDDGESHRSSRRRRPSPEYSNDSRGAKLRVDNVHYELTQDDLEGLFSKIGPVVKLEIKYDRAGRSEGTAFVTYETHADAKKAIAEFDGANAAGQPIRITMMPSGPSGGSRRNPFESAVAPGRPLAERITVPGGRSRSLSPRRNLDDEAARKGIDRYRPGRGSRSRSPQPRRRETGRRPGARRDGRGRRGDRGGGGERGDNDKGTRGKDGRTRKTQEELDAEMEDYFNPAVPSGNGDTGAVAPPQVDNQGDDIDMIE